MSVPLYLITYPGSTVPIQDLASLLKDGEARGLILVSFGSTVMRIPKQQLISMAPLKCWRDLQCKARAAKRCVRACARVCMYTCVHACVCADVTPVCTVFTLSHHTPQIPRRCHAQQSLPGELPVEELQAFDNF